MSNTPSDAELESLISQNLLVDSGGQCAFESWADIRPELVKFARAVLEKWGTPQPVNLGFTIENRAGIDVLVWKDGGCQPATSAEVAMWKALAAVQQPVVREPELDQFLSDVMTAAGLVTHGKQCKQLGERLGAAVMKLRVHNIPQKGCD